MRYLSLKSICFLFLVIELFFWSCKKEEELSTPIIRIESFSINTTSLNLEEGMTDTLHVQILPASATYQTCHWSSTDTTIAQVKDGAISAKKAGSATVTARIKQENKEVKCEIKVTARPIPVTGVQLNTNEVHLKIAQKSEKIAVSILPKNATNKEYTWHSSDSTIAIVEEDCIIGVASGEAEIWASTQDGNFKGICKVLISANYIPVESIQLTPSSIEIQEGEQTSPLQVHILPKDATSNSPRWHSSDTTVVRVKNGILSALKPGKATIFACIEQDDKEAQCEVTVTARPVSVTGIQLNMKEVRLKPSQKSEKIIVSILPENATNKEYTWHSSNSEIAIVEENCIIGVASGEADIWASTQDGNFKGVCKVFIEKEQIAVKGISLNKSYLRMTVGQTPETLIATVIPENASNKEVVWHSSNENVARIYNQQVQVLSQGTAEISATTLDGNFRASCTVDVEEKRISGGGFLLPGVSIDNGWFDVNKIWDKEDKLLCWAAAASNIIDWWQSGIPAHKRPSKAPFGPTLDQDGNSVPTGNSHKGQSQVFLNFRNHSSNNSGDITKGLNWFFTNTNYLPGEGSIPQGGYYQDIFKNQKVARLESVVRNSKEEAITFIKNLLTEAVSKGYGIGLSYGTRSGGHALTCWGYELGDNQITKLPTEDDLMVKPENLTSQNGDRMITHLYCTDSDDGPGGMIKRPKSLFRAALMYNDNGTISFVDSATRKQLAVITILQIPYGVVSW